MSIIADAVAGFTGIGAGFAGDVDDRWYQPYWGGVSPTGLLVTSETIFMCSVVLAALRWRADIFSQAQPIVVRKLGTRKREEVPDHYAQVVLRDPNAWMTGVRWRHYNMIWAQLGNAYNEIIGGRNSVVEELRPIDPTLIRVKSQRADGSLVYEYSPPGKPREEVSQEKILHFRGLSTDGVQGLPMSNLLRNAVGIALLAEKHVATSLSKGARIAGLLIPEGDVGGKEKRQELAKSVNETFSGPEQTGQMGVLPWGVKFQAVSLDNQKLQMLELREFQVGDLLRFLGVPGVVVGYGEKTATYASASEFFEEARRCVLPWVVNFEAEEMKAMLPRNSGLVIKHNLDSVLRADTLKRYDALNKAAGRAWMTGNEARGIEDMDPIEDDPSMDRVAPPPNQSGEEKIPPAESKETAPRPRSSPKPPDDEEEEDEAAARLRASALQAWSEIAYRVVRRETSDVLMASGRLSQNDGAWRAWVNRYYDRHAGRLERTLRVPLDQARMCAMEHRDELLADGVGVVERWRAADSSAVGKLALLAVGEW